MQPPSPSQGYTENGSTHGEVISLRRHVIVASTLVAFALDAKWANYQDSRVEQRILGELLDEFGSAKLQIELSVRA